MRVLEYSGLDASRAEPQYRKVCEAIARGDFRSAEVKKLTGVAGGKFYRAKLGRAGRLLFTLVRHGGETCALMLEVIEHHAYEKSRFLRGGGVDEDKIAALEPEQAAADAQVLRYLHPERGAIRFLDRPLSFDDAQEAIYRAPPPLVGGAGSGKTALTLEKMKDAEGEVLYVTHSAFLAQSARDLYYAQGFERAGQEAVFLSYREFVESLRVPAGREALWRDFGAWFTRQRQAFKGIDAHEAFEEIRGVILAEPGGALGRDAYRALGVRQSIFAEAERDRLYDLYERYRSWLAEARLYDLGLVAQEWLPLAAPRYDFVVVDEVEDLTPAQLLRAVRNVYLIESDTGHDLLRLLGLTVAADEVKVDARASSREDWQNEARRLELQGKQEQADAIRASILQEVPVPWPVFGEPRLRELLVKVLRERAPGGKLRQQLYEYATCYHERVLAERLATEGDSTPRKGSSCSATASGASTTSPTSRGTSRRSCSTATGMGWSTARR